MSKRIKIPRRVKKRVVQQQYSAISFFVYTTYISIRLIIRCRRLIDFVNSRGGPPPPPNVKEIRGNCASSCSAILPGWRTWQHREMIAINFDTHHYTFACREKKTKKHSQTVEWKIGSRNNLENGDGESKRLALVATASSTAQHGTDQYHHERKKKGSSSVRDDEPEIERPTHAERREETEERWMKKRRVKKKK